MIKTCSYAIALTDNGRVVAVARKMGTGWLVTGYGICWMDKGDTKNVLGIANP